MAAVDSNTALNVTGSVCSVIGLLAVIALQNLDLNDHTLLFWWLTTIFIAVAALATCFSTPSFVLRIVFAIVFVAELPAFDRSWGELHERDTAMRLRLGFPSEDEQKIAGLEKQNAQLLKDRRDSLLFWKSIVHLTGAGFALLACTAAGQVRVRVEHDAG